MSLSAAKEAAERETVLARFEENFQETEALASGLLPEDQSIQSMPDVSPTKWHLAHTAWFFETFILIPSDPLYRVFDPAFAYLFNSYYEAIGPRHPRPQRGLLSRPGVTEIGTYREHVARGMRAFSARTGERLWRSVSPRIELGIQHEKQHQELILMDIKHVFSINPLFPAYRQAPAPSRAAPAPLLWIEFPGGLEEIGFAGDGFHFDNESPRHKVWLEPYRLASRLVTCGEYLAFIEDDGYRRPEFWLSDGRACVEGEGWRAPLYWRREEGHWRVFTLSGERSLEPAEPVCHLSFYEADAFARWAGKRLPSEAEWEVAAREVPLSGNLAGRRIYHPCAAPALASGSLSQMIGDVWEWTASPYAPYPRFRAERGAIGEYNAKFMCNQMVLRGGAAITPEEHIRVTYRNFFPPSARWAFSGLRLAEDC